jgi:hypothetical protein
VTYLQWQGCASAVICVRYEAEYLVAVMRTFLPILTVSLYGVRMAGAESSTLVIENATPIVRTGRTTEAFGIETLGGVFTPLINLTMRCSERRQRRIA